MLLSLTVAGCAAGDAPRDAGRRDDVPLISSDSGPGCTSDPQCDDRVACTVDLCEDGACSNSPCPGNCCGDGLECVPGFGCRTAPMPCTEDEECLDDIACTLDFCRASRCEHMPEAGLCGAGEICLPAVGCITEPPTECTSVDDCDIGLACVVWSCGEFGCEFQSLVSCDDGMECTTDACSEEAGGCTHTRRDADEDGFGDAACGADDCDDSDPAIHPGAVEICGGPDEDCDGTIDEDCCAVDLPCDTACGTIGRTFCDGATMGCQPPAEVCNGVDDDCVNGVDDVFDCVRGASESCATDCSSAGSRACSDACAWSICEPPDETCNGRDDDCDGVEDNGFTCAAGEMSACMTSCSTFGTQTCRGDCTPGTCVPPAETCNGIDDNCVGGADEGFACIRGESESCTTTCGTIGSHVCGSSCSYPATCTPPAEVCNGVDDNCIGGIDEGFPCRPGQTQGCGCSGLGTQTCQGNCMWGACSEPGEICNGSDDNCNGVCDDGFACCRGATETCTTSCDTTGMRTCGSSCTWPSSCTPPPEVCNGIDDNCVGGVDEGFTCRPGQTQPCGCGGRGTQTCAGNCTWGTCIQPTEICNGMDDDCDGTCDDGFGCCQGATGSCASLGFVSGTATCQTGCTWNTSMCSNCGDGDVDAPEQCDMSDLGGNNCTTIGMGFTGGTLSCTSGCTFNTAACHRCGNGVRNPPEACDGTDLGGSNCTTIGMGFTGGTLGCTSSCTYNTSMCMGGFDPSGRYTSTPSPSLRCAFGLVNFNISHWDFFDNGTSLTVSDVSSVSPGIPCVMMGSSAETSRMIDVTCTAPGDCDEIYTLTGMFTDDDNWTGTFRVQYVGSCFDCPGTRMWSVSGRRI